MMRAKDQSKAEPDPELDAKAAPRRALLSPEDANAILDQIPEAERERLEQDGVFIPDSIALKWVAEGVATLGELADRLREYANELQDLEEAGWQLLDPVDGGVGQLLNRDWRKRLP